jgi:hypothetical protein
MQITYTFNNGYKLSDNVQNTDEIEAFINYINDLKKHNVMGELAAETPAEAESKSKPATEKQKATMIKFRIPFKNDITCAEASALIEESINEGKQKAK